MGDRPDIPMDVLAQVTTKCHKVCALCWAFERDGRTKDGQLAHINRKSHDHREENLAWLCLPCHDKYDTTGGRHSKAHQPAELRIYKAQVEKAVVDEVVPRIGGQDTALIGLKIRAAFAYPFAEGAMMEIWFSTSNSGQRATGFENVFLTKSGDVNFQHYQDARGRTSFVEACFRKDAEYLTLAAEQMVLPGQVKWWGARFLTGSDFLKDPNLIGDSRPKLYLRPVVGPAAADEVLAWERRESDPNAPVAAQTVENPHYRPTPREFSPWTHTGYEEF